MFERLRSREVEDFAIVLARDFSARYALDGARKGIKSALALARAVDDICGRAAEFQRARRLGFYRKARFGTAFTLQLKESGYPEEFVDELTRKLLISMSGK